jgi:hypothetical protein
MCIEAVYKGTNNFLRYFSGVKINSIDVEASEGSETKATANLMIAQSTTLSATVSAITEISSVPYMFHQGAVTVDTYAFDVTGFKWTVNNNLKRRWTIRSTAGKYAKMIIEGKRDYEIEAKILIPDASTYNTKIYNMLMSGTTFTSTFSLTRTAGTDDMSLTASNCTIRSAPHNIPESGEEVEVAVRIKPRTCAWTTHDSIATY